MCICLKALALLPCKLPSTPAVAVEEVAGFSLAVTWKMTQGLSSWSKVLLGEGSFSAPLPALLCLW